jgi:hypothetical protein
MRQYFHIQGYRAGAHLYLPSFIPTLIISYVHTFDEKTGHMYDAYILAISLSLIQGRGEIKDFKQSEVYIRKKFGEP